MTVYLHGMEFTNVFRLAGSDENSASCALGLALDHSPQFLKLFFMRPNLLASECLRFVND